MSYGAVDTAENLVDQEDCGLSVGAPTKPGIDRQERAEKPELWGWHSDELSQTRVCTIVGNRMPEAGLLLVRSQWPLQGAGI